MLEITSGLALLEMTRYASYHSLMRQVNVIYLLSMVADIGHPFPFKHKALFCIEEFDQVTSNLKTMINGLDEAQFQSIDPPTTSPPTPSNLHHTGAPGRPRFEIGPDVLQSMLAVEPKTQVANILQCCPRTIRRRQVELENQTGIPLTPQRSAMSDVELDLIIGNLLQQYPHYGQSMLLGAMAFHGHVVSERRVRESFSRVCGAPSRFFGSRRIHRRKYYVPAANSLWHHDGQHGIDDYNLPLINSHSSLGLIRWKIVIHAFIDGKTRFIVGIRAHNNNRAQTVLDLFLDIIDVHGCPSRLRGDHGVENVKVANYMEQKMGQNRGSYIWGR